jgi:hypothetical protein
MDTMDEQQNENLRRRYGYDEWLGRNRLSESLTVWQFVLGGNELPGWQPQLIQPLGAGWWPPAMQSTWRRQDTAGEALVTVDTYECASREAAHQFLVRLLGEFQSPLVARQEPPASGDVAFAGPGEGGIVFATGNLVVSVQNAGSELAPVPALARQFDDYLTGRPQTVDGRGAPEITRFEPDTKAQASGAGVPLIVDATDPLGRPVWFKFYASGGEVVLEGGQPVYRPLAGGPQQLTLYAINTAGTASSQTLQVAGGQ